MNSKEQDNLHERLLALEEMAALLNVSKRTLYYWVTRREVPFTKIGKHIRFAPSEVLAFFREKTQQHLPCSLEKLLVEKDFRSLTIRKGGLAEPIGVSNANR